MVSELQERKFAAFFALADRDEDGYLDKDDFDQVFDSEAEEKGWSPGSHEYESLQAYYGNVWNMLRGYSDRDRDDKVSKEEMTQALVNSPEFFVGGMAQFFDIFDDDNDGKISATEYRKMFPSFARDPAAVDEAFSRLDGDDDGYISKDEWKKLAAEFVESDDPEDPGNYLWGPF
jgi:juvenile hormone diol kinase